MNPACEDHDLIVEKEMAIAQAIGYYHPKHGCFAIEKYVATEGETHWKKASIKYTRVFRDYSPAVIRETRKSYYEPSIKAFFPFVRGEDIRTLLKPEDGIRRILSSCRDELEMSVLELYDELRAIGIRPGSIGVAGSILAGIHSLEVSDIDMTVRGCRESEALIESKVLSPLSGKEFEMWVKKNSERLNMPPEIVKKMYSPAKRGKFKGRLVSLIPLLKVNEAGSYQAIEGEPAGEATLIIELDEPSCHSYIYPSLHKFKIVKVVEGSDLLREGMHGEVLSYEGLFSNVLSTSSKVLVRGKVYLALNDKMTKIIVGTREINSYVKGIERWKG